MSYGRRSEYKKSGRGGGIRTPDILLPKQVRYQTALHPAMNEFIAGDFTLSPALSQGRGRVYCEADSAGAGGGGGLSSRRAGGSSSALRDRRTRPLSSASSTFTFTI